MKFSQEKRSRINSVLLGIWFPATWSQVLNYSTYSTSPTITKSRQIQWTHNNTSLSSSSPILPPMTFITSNNISLSSWSIVSTISTEWPLTEVFMEATAKIICTKGNPSTQRVIPASSSIRPSIEACRGLGNFVAITGRWMAGGQWNRNFG